METINSKNRHSFRGGYFKLIVLYRTLNMSGTVRAAPN